MFILDKINGGSCLRTTTMEEFKYRTGNAFLSISRVAIRHFHDKLQSQALLGFDSARHQSKRDLHNCERKINKIIIAHFRFWVSVGM